jgi:hypothetical protein
VTSFEAFDLGVENNVLLKTFKIFILQHKKPAISTLRRSESCSLQAPATGCKRSANARQQLEAASCMTKRSRH